MTKQPHNIEQLQKEIAKLTEDIHFFLSRSYFMTAEEYKKQRVAFQTLVRKRNALIKSANGAAEYDKKTHPWPDNTIDG
jgi:ElaB/YqjD/DUF883 family membrane-anchored ribosome-binding protein